ncbi:MAG: cyclase family protein [Saprospiraceae bacterium]|nr:cyclase family protein [Saprospiraceae bacterium]
MKSKAAFYAMMIAVISFDAIQAQTRDQGPWWPHPIWGAEDQAGASNWITAEKVLEAVALVTTGKIYELGNVYERDMPFVGNRSFNLLIPSFPTYPPSGKDRVVYNDEFLATQIGQVGTQFDGPGHVGKQMEMADGSTTEVFYNGYTTAEMKDPYGLKKLGIENVKPYVTRGILIDVAAAKNLDQLPGQYQVTMEDVRNTLSQQGMTEEDIHPGDALLFNFGWWRNWPKPISLEKPPYISHEVTEWIIARNPSMVGSDCTLDGPGANVHLEVTLQNGIWNLEWMRFDDISADKLYRFMFIFTPLRIKGATGSPGRPIAVG